MGVLLPLHLLQPIVQGLDLAPLLLHFGQTLVHGPDLGLQFTDFIRPHRRRDQRSDRGGHRPDQHASG